ncbi:hypothetical protein TNCV_728411 [Trichonephila clavipes]|nr:hypothetical protein TNCV_728411 [Trichonephila clavipes]
MICQDENKTVEARFLRIFYETNQNAQLRTGQNSPSSECNHVYVLVVKKEDNFLSYHILGTRKTYSEAGDSYTAEELSHNVT